ncbi:hypothetical protein BCR37DRAFT_90665 [Protomyces lactucae-debilis]|uniref:Uncharacterized protein n=1 Tax=Protomyces lactucae-debilis TaxID=2754530 RepID=A0A1Y2F959_PROLT|nr:uncharacterized protein BCR37DRAFT_90665 [Protomyces lactucae-debilis]ORY79435.1 hypothetical protein BCR37DRAFT_90665 [Protomyces lactucae-debilis]
MRLPVVASKAIGPFALSFLLLLFYQGSQAKGQDCQTLSVRANLYVHFARLPTCEPCSPLGTSRDKERKAFPCPDVCDQRIADLMYDTAKFRLDPCMRVMNPDNLSEWDILFRDPNRENYPFQVPGRQICHCSVTLVVQRLVKRLPDTDPRQSPFAPILCAYPYPGQRMVSRPLRIKSEHWYPALQVSMEGWEYGTPLREVGWIYADMEPYPVQQPSICCDAGVRDLRYAEDTSNQIASGVRLDLDSNCTIKFGHHRTLLQGQGVLCCTPDVWGGIRKRLVQLHEKDPDWRTYRNEIVNLRSQIGILCFRHSNDTSLADLVKTAVTPQWLSNGVFYMEFR